MHTFISQMIDTCANEIQNKHYVQCVNRMLYPYICMMYLWSFLVIVLLATIAVKMH